MRFIPKSSFLVIPLISLAACAARRDIRRVPIPPPPAAEWRPITETLHGVEVPDPFRRLEEVESDDTLNWARAQDAYARRVLDGEGLARIRKEVARDARAADMNLPLRRGNALYFLMSSPGFDNPPLLRKDLDTGATRVLVDPGPEFAVRDFRPDPAGRTLAYALEDKARGEWTWRFRDLATGRDLPVRLAGGSIHGDPWLAGGREFITFTPPAPRGGTPARVRSHDLTGRAAPRLLFENTEAPEVATYPDLTEDRRYLVVSVFEGSNANRILLQPLDPSGRTPPPGRPPLEPFAGREGSHTYVGSRGDELFFLTTHESPRGRLVRLTRRDGDGFRETTLIPEGEHPLSQVYLFGGRFLAVYLENGFQVLRILDPDGAVRNTLRPPRGLIWNDFPPNWPPFAGGTGPRAYFRSIALLDAGVFEIDMEAGTLTRIHSRGKPIPEGKYTIERRSYSSHDGTEVPMTVIRRVDPSPAFPPPVLMNVYGSYGFTFIPFFNPMFRLFLESGGIYVVPNIRGGGIHGRDWHEAGRGVNKINSVLDTVFAARSLIDNRTTVPGRLAVMGNSSGSIPAAVAAITHPELFGALLLEVPLADMIRYRRWTRSWDREFPSPDDPGSFRAALRVSPYHLLAEPRALPPVMITAGDRDRVAHVSHAYKLAAALQHAQRGDFVPILHVDWGTGHGAGKSTRQRIDTWSYELAFLFRVLAMDAGE